MALRALLALLLAAPAGAQLRSAPRVTLSAPVAAAGLAASALPPLPVSRLALAPAPLAAPALAPVPGLVPAPVLPTGVPAARAAQALRADADRLYAALASLHSREQAGEGSALADLKRAFLGQFDGALAAAPAVEETGEALRGRVKALRRERAAAAEAADAAPAAARKPAAARLAAVSGALAAAQLKAGRELLGEGSPVKPKALRRNAALWSLVGAHNSAAVAAAESAYLEAVSRGDEAFGDGRPFVTTSRWRNLHAELDDAARHGRNGRPAQAASALRVAAAALRAAGRAPADLTAAAELERLAAAPESAAILAAKALLREPRLKTVQPVSYEDMGAALRSQVHALESARADYLETAAQEAGLRRAQALLGSPRPSAEERAEARRLLEAAKGWASRGRVEAKRLAASNATPALDALERGDGELAARHAGWAADALAERRGELLRIGLSLRRRLLRALTA